ncbi:MAG: hypothetical protein R2703_02235 [Micropruina glycogenica]
MDEPASPGLSIVLFHGQTRWSIFAAHLDEVERMVERQVGWRRWLDGE